MYIRKHKNDSDKNLNRKNIILCVVLFFLIVFRGIYNSGIYAIVLLSSLIFIFLDERECLIYLVFLAPFSIVLKTSVDGMTFYNVFLFIVLIRVLLNVGRFEKNHLIIFLSFLFYCLFFSGIDKIKAIISMGAWLLFIYYINIIDVNGEKIVYAYCGGLCLSSLLALFRDKLPLIKSFLSIDIGQLKLAEDTYAERFSGLQPNPNYFSLDLTVAISCIIVLIILRNAKIYDWFYLVSLFFFGLMTVSQSFIVGIIPLIFLWLFFSSRKKIGKAINVLFVLATIAFFVYIFERDYVNLFLFRFSQRQGGSLATVTTGRSDIWMEYIQSIMNSPKIMLFGNGLNTLVDSGRGAHNTYLELLFSLGLCGCTLYICLIILSLRNIVKVRELKIPIIILLIRLFAITIITWDNIWIYLILFICLSNENKCKDNNLESIRNISKYIKNYV